MATKDQAKAKDEAVVETAAQDENTPRTTQEINFDNARETARVNAENDKNQNTVEGYEGVEVRPLENVEVINPVRNPATGKLEDDTRTLKQSPEEQVGATSAEAQTDKKAE